MVSKSIKNVGISFIHIKKRVFSGFGTSTKRGKVEYWVMIWGVYGDVISKSISKSIQKMHKKSIRSLTP